MFFCTSSVISNPAEIVNYGVTRYQFILSKEQHKIAQNKAIEAAKKSKNGNAVTSEAIKNILGVNMTDKKYINQLRKIGMRLDIDFDNGYKLIDINTGKCVGNIAQNGKELFINPNGRPIPIEGIGRIDKLLVYAGFFN